MTRATYTHRFVEVFPEELEEGVLYVSVEYGTSAHRCFCGCRCEVYSKFSPNDWKMMFDGQSVSLSPSVGNWSFSCQSHYILDRGVVQWASLWSREMIDWNRAEDQRKKARHQKADLRTELPHSFEPVQVKSIRERFVDWIMRR